MHWPRLLSLLRDFSCRGVTIARLTQERDAALAANVDLANSASDYLTRAETLRDLINDARSGYIGGSEPDLAWETRKAAGLGEK